MAYSLLFFTKHLKHNHQGFFRHNMLFLCRGGFRFGKILRVVTVLGFWRGLSQSIVLLRILWSYETISCNSKVMRPWCCYRIRVLERIGFSSEVKEHFFSRPSVFLVFVWVDSMGAVKYVNGGTSVCVIRCSRDQYRVVRAAIAFITKIRSMPLFLNLLHICGNLLHIQAASCFARKQGDPMNDSQVV